MLKTVFNNDSLHFGKLDFTIAFRVKLGRFDCRLLGKEDFPRNRWIVNVPPNGRVELVAGESTEPGKSVRPISKTALSTTDWTHVAFVVDRQQFQVKCYINGVLDTTTKLPESMTGSLNARSKGLIVPLSHKPATGFFDELKIFKRALTDLEIRKCVGWP